MKDRRYVRRLKEYCDSITDDLIKRVSTHNKKQMIFLENTTMAQDNKGTYLSVFPLTTTEPKGGGGV